MNVLELLSTRHKDWCRMVQSFGCPSHMVEDIVQEMYLRMHKYVNEPEKIMYKNEVNTLFVYISLKNMYADYAKSKSRFQTTDRIPEMVDEGSAEEREEAMQVLVHHIWAEVKTWNWYDEKLMTIYIKQEMSMRELSEETKISLSSIFNTLKNGKQRIKTNCKEAYDTWKEAGAR